MLDTELAAIEAATPFEMRVGLGEKVPERAAREWLDSADMGILHPFTTGLPITIHPAATLDLARRLAYRTRSIAIRFVLVGTHGRCERHAQIDGLRGGMARSLYMPSRRHMQWRAAALNANRRSASHMGQSF